LLKPAIPGGESIHTGPERHQGTPATGLQNM